MPAPSHESIAASVIMALTVKTPLMATRWRIAFHVVQAATFEKLGLTKRSFGLGFRRWQIS
jgi:hypothetical protein